MPKHKATHHTRRRPVRRRPGARTTAPATPAAPAAALVPKLDGLDDLRILTVVQILALLTVRNRSTLWRWCREGKFPAPVQLAPGRKGWRLADVREWLRDREQHPVTARRYFPRPETDPQPPVEAA